MMLDLRHLLFTIDGKTMYYDGLLDSQKWTMRFKNGYTVEFLETQKDPKPIKFVNDWVVPVHIEVVRSNVWNLSRLVDPSIEVDITDDVKQVIVTVDDIDKMTFTRISDGWNVKTPKDHKKSYTCDSNSIRLHIYYDPYIFMNTLFATESNNESRAIAIDKFKNAIRKPRTHFWIKTTHKSIINQIIDWCAHIPISIIDYDNCVYEENVLVPSTRGIIERVIMNLDPDQSVVYLHNIDADYDIETHHMPWMDDAMKVQKFKDDLHNYLSQD